ncbi:hypothetical protein D1115_17895 [Vibrio alfacsensis]|uniref:Uncharacterized protein n=1 Tax=Vibrio alfacsensis TaxID=1074311 RepID=A0ABM6YYG4_9VIBR|nr:hypothetical protein D1115_17895 [Vibrio alfacsensis]
MTLGIFLTGLPFVVVFYYYINDLVTYILGDEWSESGTYSKYILIWVFMSIVNVATTPAFTIIAENKRLLQYECVDFIVKTF